MDIPRCANCGLPVESSNYYMRGMAIRCRNCSFSGLPLSAGVCFYDRINVRREVPQDLFKEDLASAFSKLALAGLSLSIICIWSVDLRGLAIASFASFIIFSALSLLHKTRVGA